MIHPEDSFTALINHMEGDILTGFIIGIEEDCTGMRDFTG
jgi:hypothetical protein